MRTLVQGRDLSSSTLAHIICREVGGVQVISGDNDCEEMLNNFLLSVGERARAYKTADAAAMRF